MGNKRRVLLKYPIIYIYIYLEGKWAHELADS